MSSIWTNVCFDASMRLETACVIATAGAESRCSERKDLRIAISIFWALNTDTQGSLLREALQGAWGVSGEFTGVPIDAIAALARDKYGSPAWNLRL